jgi:hypothetical protein
MIRKPGSATSDAEIRIVERVTNQAVGETPASLG